MTAVDACGLDDVDEAVRKVGRSAALLTIRRLAVAVMSAFATAVVAHETDLADFGAFSAGLAAFYLLQAACDFGFGTVLARELAQRPGERRSLLVSTVLLATGWSAAVAIGLLALSAVAGFGSSRGLVMLALVAPLALSGLGVVRQLFLVDYRVRTLARIDLTVNLAQSVGLCVLALIGVAPWLLAMWIGVSVTVGGIWLAGVAFHVISGHDRAPLQIVSVARLAAPLGLVSFLASAYFLLDVTIDGYLVSTARLAQYAAAVKVLSIVVSLPALVMSAALPAMSLSASDRESMGRLAARLWHWFAVTLVPLTVGLFVFAPFIVRALFGSRYVDAVGLLRVLLAAAAVALLSNVVGNVLVVDRRAGSMLAQNAGAVIVNVVGNILLVPRVGVVASAWLTVATEVGVCSVSVLLLRGSMSFRPLLRVSLRPGLALLLIVAAWAIPVTPVAMLAAALLFLGATTLLRGWPSEFPLVGRYAR